MKIGYDAKRAFFNNRGLGNYSRNTIQLMSRFYPEEEFSFFLRKRRRKELFFNKANIAGRSLRKESGILWVHYGEHSAWFRIFGNWGWTFIMV